MNEFTFPKEDINFLLDSDIKSKDLIYFQIILYFILMKNDT